MVDAVTFPLQPQRHERQRNKYLVIALACFMLPLTLEALHIVGQISSKQCWKVSNQMLKIRGCYELLKRYYHHTGFVAIKFRSRCYCTKWL